MTIKKDFDMKLETATGEWINSRYIIVYYIEKEFGICCKTINNDIYLIVKPEHDPVTKDLLDDVVRIISARKLNTITLSQHDLWKDIGKSLKIK